ncbi:MAG: hypothetical protein ACXADY_24535 [Candidatus Hodarchaeales archaeon]
MRTLVTITDTPVAVLISIVFLVFVDLIAVCIYSIIPAGLLIASWILDNILRLFYFEIIILLLTWIMIWVGEIGVVLISRILGSITVLNVT